MAEMQDGSAPSAATAPRRRWLWIVAVLVLVAAGVFFAKRGKFSRKPGEGGTNSASSGAGRGEGTGGGGRGGRGGPGGPVMVGVAKAQSGDIGVYVSALGVVTPLSTVAIRSRVEGQLIKTYYDEGQIVKEGDPLAEIDPAPYQAALAQAEGQLARDQASLENAKLDFGRYKEAFARNAVPKQQLDTQNSSVRQFEGAVKFDQGQVETAKVQLNYCHIRAPVSGRVGLRLVDVGNIVRANDTNPLVVITQLKPISVVFSVAEDHLPRIQKQVRAGRRLPVEAWDRAEVNRIATGMLQTVDNQIDVGTGTVKLKAMFTNDDEALFPNQFVNARLLVETHQGVTTVPNVAIQRGSQGAFVFEVKSDQTVVAHPITIKASEGNISEADGLEAGTMVAVDNFNRLNDGAKVAIRPSGEGARGGQRGGRGGEGQRGNGQRGSSPDGGGQRGKRGEG